MIDLYGVSNHKKTSVYVAKKLWGYGASGKCYCVVKLVAEPPRRRLVGEPPGGLRRYVHEMQRRDWPEGAGDHSAILLRHIVL